MIGDLDRAQAVLPVVELAVHLEQHVDALVLGVLAALAQALAHVLHDLRLGHSLGEIVAKDADAPAAHVGGQVHELHGALDGRLPDRRIGGFVALAGRETGHLQPGLFQESADAAALLGRGFQLDAVLLVGFAAELDAVKAVGRKQF